MRHKRRPAEMVLADLDNLRNARYAKRVNEDEYRKLHDELWDELREGDWERHNAERRRQDRANDKQILREHGYRSIREALGDGWRKLLPTYGLVGGQQMSLSRHTLAKGCQEAYSETHWKRSGYRIKDGERPAGSCLAAYGGGSFAIYTESQVEKTERLIRREALQREQNERIILPRLLSGLA